MINPWLKDFKAAKKLLQGCKVALFDQDSEGLWVLIPNTEKPLAPTVTWDVEGLNARVCGGMILDRNGSIIWQQEQHHMIITDHVVSVTFDFRKLKVNGKWDLDQILPEVHC